MQADGRILSVHLGKQICSCRRYQRNGIPCGHAPALINILSRPFATFLPSILSATTWAAVYAITIPPIAIEFLNPDEADPCPPPLTRFP